MGRSLNAEEIDEILETYAETESRQATAEETGHSETTVRKYVNEAIEEGDPRMPEVSEDEAADDGEDAVDVDPGQTPFGREGESRVIEDYSGMTPGDFIEEFFEDFEVGIRNDWIAIQARRADRRSKLPTQESLMKDLLNMKSGISASSFKEAEYIAIEYWAEAQNFLRATSYEAEATPITDQTGGPQPAGIGGNPQQGGFGQDFVGPGGSQPGVMGQGGQQQMVPILMQELRQMRQELRENAGSRNNRGSEKDTLGRLKELREEKQILEELSGGDDRLEQIEAHIQNLQREVASDGPAAAPMPMGEDKSMEERLLDLAAQDPEVSIQEVLGFIEDREETRQNPEVLKKEKEMEIEKMKLENEQQRNEKLAETLSSLADKIGEGIGKAIVDSGDEAAAAADASGASEAAADGGADAAPTPDVDQQPTQPVPNGTEPQAEPQQQEEQYCPHCESVMDQGPAGVHCPECEYGIGSCDLCGFPVEIPPKGEATWGRCGECESFVERPDDPEETVECDNCDWEGHGEEVRGEALKCDGCEEIRPIQRSADPEEVQDRLEEIMGD